MSTVRRISVALAIAAAAVGVAVSNNAGAAPAQAPGDDVRLNEIQVVGSHNSYHLLPSAPELALRRQFIQSAADLMEYRHVPLAQQFGEQKVRQIELDVFVDNAGGRYADPLLRRAAGVTDPLDPAMSQPGLKVFHIQDVDYESTCITLVACLEQIETWSDANPGHVPIAVLLELKDTPLILGDLPFVLPEPFDAAAMAEVDDVIRSVFDPTDLITPDDVRGSHATLPEAIAAGGWPTLGDSRGKVMFLMDNGGSYRNTYLQGAPNLAGRPIFTNGVAGAPDAAFLKRNDPMDPAIPDLVRQGYVVRTRSDADTLEARSGDVGPRDAALASGAQWVSTDYPVPNFGVGFDTSYVVEIPGGTVARCNPVLDPPGCVASTLDLAQVDPPTTTTTSTTTTTTTAVPTSTTAPTSTSSTTSTPTVLDDDRDGVPQAPGARPVRGRPSYTG